MKMFKDGDIVWVNLGFSYGWWPGNYVESKLKNPTKSVVQVEFSQKPSTSLMAADAETNPPPKIGDDGQIQRHSTRPSSPALPPPPKKEPIAMVRFFDDERFDTVRVFDTECIKSYSCDEKKR